jgi:hypothetical protein
MRSRLLVVFVALAVGGLSFISTTPAGAQELSDEVAYHRITFPALGGVRYSNDWGNARTGHVHQGNDLLGAKLQPEVAAESGVVEWVREDGSNMLSLRGDSGWHYWYIHINNDTPGTDDGANPAEFRFAPGIRQGSRVVAGQFIAYMGDSGNAEGTSPHLHFEMHKPDGTPVDPYWSLLLSQGRRANDRCAFDDNPDPEPSIAAAPGYWSTTADGAVYSFGGAPYLGSMGGKPLSAPVIGLTATPDDGGYWQLSRDGGIFSFGDARFFGSTGAMKLNAPVVGMASTPPGRGYWLVASDGGIFSFGDARFAGSTGAMRLNKPIVAMAPTKSGRGYWLVASDGGVFSFGDARYLGSTGGNAMFPIVDVTPTPTGAGYWLTTSVGSVLAYGDAAWHGGADKIGFCTLPNVVALTPTRSGDGYWLQAADGNVFPFGDAVDHGSPKRLGVPIKPAVGLAAA